MLNSIKNIVKCNIDIIFEAGLSIVIYDHTCIIYAETLDNGGYTCTAFRVQNRF